MTSPADALRAPNGSLDETIEAARAWLIDLQLAMSQVADKALFENPRIEDPATAVEAMRHLSRTVAFAGLNMVENHNPAYPHIHSFETPWLQWALPNPDFRYLMAPLHGDYEYRVTGLAGTCHFFSVEIYSGSWDKVGEVRNVASHDDFRFGPGREVNIVLSRFDRGPTSVRIPEGEAYLCIREAFYDWETETPSYLNIERIGATYPPPPLSAGALSARMDRMTGFFRNGALAASAGTVKFFELPVNSIEFGAFPLADRSQDDHIGFKGQHYGRGHYRCGADEALILEVAPPACRYWMFGLASHFQEGLEWHERQTAINGHQAVLDRDGVFRAVIAHRDPGVPNWLDTGGRQTGLLAGRYNDAAAADPLGITLRAAPLDQVRNHFPADTPIVTPTERSDWLRRRMLSVRRRQMGFN